MGWIARPDAVDKAGNSHAQKTGHAIIAALGDVPGYAATERHAR